MKGPSLNLRGDRQGLIISWELGSVEELIAQLGQKFEGNTDFYRGGRVMLNVGQLDLSAQDVEDVQALLTRKGMQLRGFITSSTVTENAAAEAGLHATEGPLPHDGRQPLRLSDFCVSTGVLIRRTLRSGQTIQDPGHVVIVGDVNPGAEIIAGGDIVIWGKLRGVVHAGASGNSEAVVCALELTPTQLRIGNHIAVAPEQDEALPCSTPEIARVQDDGIVVEPWE